ncbi:Esterase alnB-like protein [Cladobotryum mycophilum]|uniref:Esterase alnB-like protein n=1 Tax=Cladobotryum mycophilum TaxID=491253 RepID=A0ABR0SIM0_9HYPO
MSNIRVLCLHGMGANAQIFRQQTAAFRSLLPPTYQFTFLDGIEACTPPADLAGFHSGPYLCWYRSPTVSKVARAQDHILSFIKNNGPFDVVMGFSQGASLAASLIIHDQIENPGQPSLFKAAIFLCAPLPFSRCLTQGIDTRKSFGLALLDVVDGRPTEIPTHLIPKDAYFLQADEQADCSEEFCKLHASCSISKPNISSGVYYQMFHSTVDGVKINIPTTHVYGRSDPWKPHSMDLIDLCSREKALIYQHDGGHEIPRDEGEGICDIIESTVIRSLISV